MSLTEARMSQLVRWDARKGAAFVHALRLDLDKETEQRIGRAYGIIAVDAAGRQGEALAAHLEDAFTRGAQEAVRKLPGDAPQDQLFEAAIGRTNHALLRLLGENGLGIEAESASAAIIALRGHDMVAATWGSPSLVLYHPLPNGSSRAFNLADEGAAEPAAFRTANARRCFGSIIAGRLGKRDRLLLSSQDVRQYLGEEALSRAVIDHEPTEATSVLNRLISPRNEQVSIALLVLDVTEVRYLESDPSVARTHRPANAAASLSKTSASIEKLLKTQSDTGETLEPSLMAGMAGLGKKMTSMLRREESPAADAPLMTDQDVSPSSAQGGIVAHSPETADAHGDDRTLMSAALGMAVSGSKTAGKAAIAAAVGSGKFLMTVANKEKRRANIAAGREKTDAFMNNLVDRYNDLAKPAKALLLAALTLAIVARGGTFASAMNQAKEAQVAEYEFGLAAIQQKIDSAEASAIYRDEARAGTLLAEAEAAAQVLPEKKPAEQAAKAALLAKIADGRDQLRREVTVGQPDILASISSGSGAASLAKMTATDDALWVASGSGEVFRLALSGGSPVQAGSVPGGGAPAVFMSQGKDVYAAAASGAGAVITAAGKQNDRPADFQNGQTVPADAQYYNSRLYVLDPSHNRITRHMAETGKYGSGEFYLKDGTDLSNAVSIAIDGVVWVLKADGSVLRIVKGLQEGFAVSPADPPVTNAVRLRTNAESDLFVLDASPTRILRYDKQTGSLKAQYVNDALTGATDFTIDAKGTVAYVTKGSTVLRVALPAP